MATFNRLALAAILTGALLPDPVAAQVINPPPRSQGGLFGGANRAVDPNRTRSTLDADVNLLGGWDDDLFISERAFVGEIGDPTGPGRAVSSGYLGVGTAEMQFWRGNAKRAFDVTGRTHLTRYSREDPLFGGDGVVTGKTELGSRMELSGAGSISHSPALLLNAFSPVEGLVTSGVIADSDPTRAVAQLSSNSAAASGRLQREWTARHQTAVAFEVHETRYLDGNGVQSRYDDNRGRSAAVDHFWALTRTGDLTFNYRYTDEWLRRDVGLDRPTETHGGEMGFRIRKPLSRTRSLWMSASGGATHVQTFDTVLDGPYDYIAFSYSGSVRLDLARTWGLAGDFRRGITTLDGVTLDTFVTDVVTLTLGGNLNDRLRTAVSGAYSTGQDTDGGSGSFRNGIYFAQVDYAFTDWWSFVAAYSYYNHHLQQADGTAFGFPEQFIRNSIRVGAAFRLPLYGNFNGPGPASN